VNSKAMRDAVGLEKKGGKVSDEKPRGFFLRLIELSGFI